MKILHIAETIRGGPATYLNEIVPLQLNELGFENVRVLVPEQHALDLIAIPPSRVACFDRPGRLTGLGHLALKVLTEIKTFKPDLLHLHSTFAGAVVRGLSTFMPWLPPAVYCPHGWAFDVDLNVVERGLAEKVECVLSFVTRKVIAISEYEYQQGLRIGIHPSKIAIVENGISTVIPKFAGVSWEDERLKVLFVGRLDKQKGFDVLLEALELIRGQATVRAIGASVNSLEGELQVPSDVELLGWLSRDQVAAQLAACDLVVMPSRWEGLPLVAIEAMRSGKAVVGTRVGGLTSMVKDGVTGVLVNKEDPRSLSSAIASRTSADWAVMGIAARERFLERYTVDRTHMQLLALYSKVTGGEARPIRLNTETAS